MKTSQLLVIATMLLAATLLLYGASGGFLDMPMNAEAAEVEKRTAASPA